MHIISGRSLNIFFLANFFNGSNHGLFGSGQVELTSKKMGSDHESTRFYFGSKKSCSGQVFLGQVRKF